MPSVVVAPSTSKSPLISTVTASSSSTIDFTSGIDSTYKEYQVHFINCHPATDGANFDVSIASPACATERSKNFYIISHHM